MEIFFSIPLLRPQAYLDPGSGSFLLQLLIAGIVGLGFVVKSYWGKILKLFKRSKKNDDTDQQQ